MSQRKDHGGETALMSLTQFDDRFEVNFVAEPLKNVPDLDATSYVRAGAQRYTTPSAAPCTSWKSGVSRTVGRLKYWC